MVFHANFIKNGKFGVFNKKTPHSVENCAGTPTSAEARRSKGSENITLNSQLSTLNSHTIH